MKHLLSLVSIILICSTNVFAQTAEENAVKGTNIEALLKFSNDLRIKDSLQLVEAKRLAKIYNWPVEIKTENSFMQLVGLHDDGSPKYYETFNSTAAISIATNKLHNNGGKGLNLEGQNMTVAEWDGGGVRATHREFGNRVTRRDAASGNSAHATHVGGTLIASGVSANAKGMAPQAKLWAYEWSNDASEMAAAAASGILVSNHSYGTGSGWRRSSGNWFWYGNASISATEDYKFGFYDSRTRDWDRMARLAPYYLIVKSAGNDRNDNHTGSHRVLVNGSWTTSSARRDPDGQNDCISTYGTAKNILTVGAVNDLPSGYVIASGVSMTTFSGWGPTDDGRIKPDIVGNGRGVRSCNSTGDAAYYSSDGTSMSSPSVAGSCILLQQHHKNLHNKYMRAATLKGLVIHSADEAGTAEGPDYSFGWGLMNSYKAVEVMNDKKAIFEELTLTNTVKNERVVFSNGINPIRVTICWTDVEGTPNTPSLNPTTIKLVNDLDVRLININNGSIYYPYRLNPLVPGSAATKGDNFRDNVEHIYYSKIPAGNYYLRVTHKGTLSSGKQDFSLIAQGFVDGPRADFSSSKQTACIGDTVFFTDKSINATAWQWSFANGVPANSVQKNPYAIFSTSGTHTVTLRAFNGALSDIKTMSIEIGNIPNAAVYSPDSTYCRSEKNSVILRPVEKNGKWQGGAWMPFIDSCKFKPSAIAAGDYTATHTLTNAQGCTDIDTILVSIRENPIVTLRIDEDEFCEDDDSVMLSGGNPTGGIYYIDNFASTHIVPRKYGAGFKTVTYHFVDSNGCAGSDVDNFSIEGCLSVNEVSAENFVRVFPNPFTSTIKLENLRFDAIVQIADVKGRSVEFEETRLGSESIIDLSKKKPGVYFISVTVGGKQEGTIRIVKE